MGVDRAYVSGLELGNRNPTVVTLWHLAKALGVAMRVFFEERNRKARWLDQLRFSFNLQRVCDCMLSK